MPILIHPTYFPSISHFVAMLGAKTITFEVEDNFQKQTNRNRMYLYSANGIQSLNIPIKHSNSTNKKYKDTRIETNSGWQKQHFKTLQTAYRTSPYFEYFEDDIRCLFETKQEFIMDLNFKIHQILVDCLGISLPYSLTTEYVKSVPNDVLDLRNLTDGKRDFSKFESYTQVFDNKHGFINNLSILDLLFNEGRFAISYLKQQSLFL